MQESLNLGSLAGSCGPFRAGRCMKGAVTASHRQASRRSDSRQPSSIFDRSRGGFLPGALPGVPFGDAGSRIPPYQVLRVHHAAKSLRMLAHESRRSRHSAAMRHEMWI